MKGTNRISRLRIKVGLMKDNLHRVREGGGVIQGLTESQVCEGVGVGGWVEEA